jgi:hypothetical protein
MAVPSSGELKLRADIALEVDGSATGDNVSLGTLSDTAGFDTPPDQMSEFYGYVSYVQPTTSGTPSTHDIFDVRMDVVSTTFTNTSAGSVERGFYFGTSTTMASNTWYSEGNTSSTSFTFEKRFSSLTGGTTYYMWAGIRDTQSPARFTETVSSMKSQATLAAVSYTTGWGGAQNLSVSSMAGAGTSAIGTMSGTIGSSYNHVYYGWSGAGGGYSRSMTHTGAAAWEGYSSAPNVTRYWGWRTDGVTTENRSNMYGSIGGNVTGYGIDAGGNHAWYSLPYGSSTSNRTLTALSMTDIGWESWCTVGTQYCSGGTSKKTSQSTGSYSTYAYNYL